MEDTTSSSTYADLKKTASETDFSQSVLVNTVPITLSWRDVKQQVDIKKFMGLRYDTTKPILHGVSGSAKSGRFLAIMGGSGSGKTSLLNIIAGRTLDKKENYHVQGEILVNDQVIPNSDIRKIMKRIAGYVTQDDHLLPNLTVRETLTFAALLKLPSTLSKEEKLAQVEAVIQELRLTKVANTIIGSTFIRGVSGGEKRRVSIGLQLLTNPSVLFLDEPTSGLDSTTAHNVIDTLLKLSRRNRTVICTIHQPRSDIFAMFDQVMLLSKGEVVYFGDGAEMVPYFTRIGHQCPKYSNPADFAVDLINVDTKNEETLASSKARVGNLVEQFKNSVIENEKQDDIKEDDSQAELSSVSVIPVKKQSFRKSLESEIQPPSAFTQFVVLLHRALQNIFRDRLSFASKLFYSLFLALLFGGVSYQIQYDQVGVTDRTGSLVLLLSLTPFMAILSCIVQWQSERVVYTRELAEGMYSATPYYFSKILSELPFDIVLNFMHCVIVYWMVNLNRSFERFIIFYVIILLEIYCSQSFGYVCAAAIPNFLSASTAANSVFTLFFLPAGWAINYESMPKAFSWIKEISYFKYGYEALMVNEFKGESFHCTAEQLAQANGYCPITTGEEVLNLYSMDGASLGRSFAVIIAIIVFLRIVFYFLLRFKNQMPVK